MHYLLFLTTTNLATNPRLVKEVQLAITKKYRVTIIQFNLNNWSDTKTDLVVSELEKSGLATFIPLQAIKPPFIPWLLWGMLEKLARWVYPVFKSSIFINALASSRRSFQLKHECNGLEPIPDLICAHNLGALYPALRLSKKWKVPFVFDVEDYHPGEYIRFDAMHEKKRREFLMKKLLPQVAALTSASPLIGEYTMKLIGGHPNHQVILNSFPKKEFSDPANHQITKSPNQLKLVWFSQKISFGRGLEQLFEALNLMAEENNSMIKAINLTIIGDLDPEFEDAVISTFRARDIGSHLALLPPMKQSDLHLSLSQYDVGLALESGKDLNNLLALSNKIIAYAQTGLYILATDTPAQKQFMEHYDGSGLLCGQTAEGMREGLLSMVRQQKAIVSDSQKRFSKAKVLAWEKEEGRLKEIWGDLLLSNIQVSKLVRNN